jgi:ARG and Rhodanese-Phosphatase-superfamily-associated Protein domain
MTAARSFLGLSLVVLILSFAVAFHLQAGQTYAGKYHVLAPLTSGNLTIFPIVADSQADTSMFLTLDEGLRNGDVVVTEAGNIQPLMRRRGPVPLRRDAAQVNTLMLVNNSRRPLLLLAGEVVTGGKQDRVIAKDRIVAPESDPVDLGVFCVEPGRWVAKSEKFGNMGSMAQPDVRKNAMAKKDQQKVWDSVNESRARATESVTVMADAAPPSTEAGIARREAVGQLQATTSYAQVMENKVVQEEVDKIAAPITRSFQSALKDLRAKNAVGVVVAVDGEILWADIFASTDLLERYWPKLVRSYAAEAYAGSRYGGKVSEKDAQAFVNQRTGTHETAETEPGVFRHSEISGTDYRVFELTSLVPKTNYTVHLAKMNEAEVSSKLERRRIPVR